jgi:hypothetical protein
MRGLEVHARPFEGVFKSQFTTDLSIFDNKFPQNGSKNQETAPRTRMGYPHEGPSVVPGASGWVFTREFSIKVTTDANWTSNACGP